ncbi:MAG: hypothetical protein P1V36_01705 [Planctomycetota bacterium]|nr:hypothetical protein [Planctomycetota bacterium]
MDNELKTKLINNAINEARREAFARATAALNRGNPGWVSDIKEILADYGEASAMFRGLLDAPVAATIEDTDELREVKEMLTDGRVVLSGPHTLTEIEDGWDAVYAHDDGDPKCELVVDLEREDDKLWGLHVTRSWGHRTYYGVYDRAARRVRAYRVSKKES